MKSIKCFTNIACRAALMGVVTALGLSGCSMVPDVPPVPGMNRLVGDEGVFRDRKADYLEAESIPRIQVPPGFDTYVIDDLLVIPDLAGNDSTAFVDTPRPRPLEGRSSREVVIQRMDERSWIIADVSPSQIWPRIRDYWRQKGVPLDEELPSQGVMETGWFVLDGNVLTKEKFRVDVEPGFQDNSAEVRLTHVSAPQAAPAMDAVNWPEQSMDQELSFEFLREMSQFLADVGNLYQASTVSFQARSLSSTGKASLVTTPSGNAMLRLRADYDRSWAALRRALTRNNIHIVHEDAELGVFDLAFDPDMLTDEEEEEEGPGFFTRLITLNGAFGGKDEAVSYRIRLQLLGTGEVVEILAVPFEENRSAAADDAVSSLMQFLRNTIA